MIAVFTTFRSGYLFVFTCLEVLHPAEQVRIFDLFKEVVDHNASIFVEMRLLSSTLVKVLLGFFIFVLNYIIIFILSILFTLIRIVCSALFIPL